MRKYSFIPLFILSILNPNIYKPRQFYPRSNPKKAKKEYHTLYDTSYTVCYADANTNLKPI